MYDYRKYNVNSFIGHSVVLQYVTVHRVEQIWSAKARLYANLPQWRHKYANLYVTSPATTSLTQSCGKHYYTLFIYHIYFFHFKFAHQSCTHKIVYIIYCVFAILYIDYLYIIILLSVSCLGMGTETRYLIGLGAKLWKTGVSISSDVNGSVIGTGEIKKTHIHLLLLYIYTLSCKFYPARVTSCFYMQ